MLDGRCYCCRVGGGVAMNSVDLSAISWVQLSYVDVFGTNHSMQLPAARFQQAVNQGELFDGSSLDGRSRLIETDVH